MRRQTRKHSGSAACLKVARVVPFKPQIFIPMKISRILLTTAFSLCASAWAAADTAKLTLADFTDAKGEKPGPGWTAEEGGIIHRTAKQGDLISVKEFSDFEIEWDWKIASGGNSGLKYWVNKFAKGGWLGIEYQMIDDAKHPDATKGDHNHSTASFYDIKSVHAEKAVKPAGEWNTSKVVAKDGKVQHFLNGVLVGELDAKGGELKECVAKSKFKSVDGFAPGHGHFLLQDHGDEVWFRNIRVTTP